MLCPKCKKGLEQAVKVINYKGRSILINILKCDKCGHTFTMLDEAEKARINLNPSFFDRIKSLFSVGDKITEAILDGRVL